MAVLNTVASIIVYTPLILIGLTVLSSIGYAVWHYKYNTPTLGTLPPSYVKALDILKFIILKILTPVKWLLQFLWWLLPVFPDRLRAQLGYTPWGAWERRNLTRTILLLSIATLITITSLVYKYGYPNTIVAYSQYLNGSLIILAIIAVFALFVSFNKTIMSTGFDDNPWSMGGNDLEERRREWVSGTTKTYLYYSIGVGLALAILFALFYFIVNYGIFSITGTTILMICSGIAGIYIIYKLLSQNQTVRRNLRSSRFLSNLFYLVFIIPCLFGDTVKYLFNQFRHTPKTAYMFLGGEILLISLYLLIPTINKYFYTMMPQKDDKVLILKRKI